MTRFARAKGSKSSNERVPESATSWRDMKSDLIKKNEETEFQADKAKRTQKMFSLGDKQEKVVKWSEFPFDDEQLKKQKQSSKKTEAIADEKPVLLVSQKKKKRKRQTLDYPESSEKNLGNDESSLNHKKNKQNKKAKKLHSTDSTETTVVPEENTSSDNLNNEFDKKVYNKPSNKIKQFQRGNFSGDQSFNKKNDRGEHKRRKPINEVNKIYINGNEIELSYYDGFPIKKVDADRLKELKKEMISRGLPKSEVMSALKLERRKAEKSLAREKKKVCFNCRRSGHTLSECPALKGGSDGQLSETGICFKCGSTEHTHFECRVTRGDNFKFAQCFICKEQGHIARQCPDNNKGLYPKGGACRICGDVTHLKKDCPKYQFEQEENRIVAHTIDEHNIESLENENKKVSQKQQNPQNKIIKF